MHSATTRHRPAPQRALPALIAGLAALAVLAAGCAGQERGQLLVAENTAASSPNQGASRVWAVDPGDRLTSSALVSSDAVAPIGVSTVGSDGLAWFNQLGRTWRGDALLAYRTERSAVLTGGRPGAKQLTMATSNDGTLQAVVLRRGVAVINQRGCSLATDVAKARAIGTGSCQISEDERWVVSWRSTPGALSIRDLRTDRTRVVRDIKTTNAVALGRGAAVLAIAADGAGVRGRVIDATDGSTVATTKVYQRMQPLPSTAGATGFVTLAQAGTTVELLWIAADGTVSTVDTSPSYLLPVAVTSGVTYLRLGDTAAQDSVRRWSPGGRPEVLLTGRVGVSAATPDSVVVTRDTDRGVEFYRTGPSRDLERVLTLGTDTTQGTLVDNMAVQGDIALMQVTSNARTSFVRIDLRGDRSDAPVRNRPFLLLESVDADGTALLTTSEGQGQGEQLLVVGRDDRRATVRARADATGTNLIRGGVVYWTEQTAAGSVSVRSVRAKGKPDARLLYRNRQVAGATWAQDNGATRAVLVSRALLVQNQAQAQAQGQGQGAGQGQGQGQGADTGG